MKKIFANVLLAVVAILLATLLFPAAFVFSLLANWKKTGGTENIAKMIFELARGIDQTGNAFCFQLFNASLLKDDKLAPFGNVDETISSVIGRNKQLENLTWFGRLLDLILDGIDVNHTIKSIGN